MDLKIDKSHTRGSRRNDTCYCPTGIAFKRAGFEDVRVYQTSGCVRDPKTNCLVEFPLPTKLISAIIDFDQGKPFKIGTYRIKGLKRPR
jgi:hypothetical protein